MTFNLHALRRERLIQFVTSAVLVDILFLPYLQAFIFPLSLPFVVAAIFFDRRFYISNTNLFLFSIVIGLVFLSVLMSVLLKSNDYLVEDLKRAFQFLTSFFYFAYFYYAATVVKTGVVSRRILFCFLSWFFFMSVYFYFYPINAHVLLEAIYGKTVTSIDVVSYHQRFAYLFTDPNTAAYFLLIACGPFAFFIKSRLLKLLVFCVIGLSLITTQSRGGGLTFGLCVLLGFFISSAKGGFKRKAFVLWSLLVLSGLIYVVVSFDEAFDMSSAFFTLFRRYAEAREYSGDSRLDIWLNIVRNVEPYFIGRGYVIEVGGEPVQPHSDAIRFVYAYGILLFFMVLFFLGFMLYNYPLFAIPAIAAFFINTLIDEQKLLALYFCWAGVIFGLRRTEGGKTRGDIHSCFFR